MPLAVPFQIWSWSIGGRKQVQTLRWCFVYSFLALFNWIWVENLCYIYLFCLMYPRRINHWLFHSSLCRVIVLVWISFVHSSLCLQLKTVSYSHRTISTYITSKLTPFESVKCIIILHLLYYDYMIFTHAYTPVITFVIVILCCSVIFISLSHCKFPLD